MVCHPTNWINIRFPPHPSSLFHLPLTAKCGAPGNATYRNIVFRNVTIDSPKGVPGVILANATSPMENVTFDGVVVHHPSSKKEPWGTGYLCEGVASGVATGGTSPVPGCFKGTAGMV